MNLIKTELEPKTIGEKIRDVRDFEQHPGWANHLLSFLQELEREHTEQGISQKLTPASRAEHIEAIHALRKIINFPKTKIQELEIAWKNSQKKQASS